MTQTTQGLKSCEKLMVTWRPTHRDTGFRGTKSKAVPRGGPKFGFGEANEPMRIHDFFH